METIFHAFGMRLQTIDLEMIKHQGFTAVQLNVLQPCKEGDEWWKSYQPLDFTIGNKFGSKEDLIILCFNAKALDLKVIVDVVLRHSAGADSGELKPHNNVAPRLISNPYFWTKAPNAVEWDRYNTIRCAMGLPMLDYDNWELQDIYIDFLQELKDCGVNGFRIDMGKHFALPDEGSCFWERVFGRFSDMFNYAECLLDCDRLNDYAKHVKVLTNGRTANPEDTVAFIMTHDSELGCNSSTAHYTDENIIEGWKNLDKRHHVLFYPRNDLWKSEKIREINLNRIN